MQNRKRKDAPRRAFTLMEVLLVLVILVVLMGFAVPSLLGSKKKADLDAAKTQIGLFRPALEKYALDIGTFPSSEQGLAAPAREARGPGRREANRMVGTLYLEHLEGSLGSSVLV